MYRWGRLEFGEAAQMEGLFPLDLSLSRDLELLRVWRLRGKSDTRHMAVQVEGVSTGLGTRVGG